MGKLSEAEKKELAGLQAELGGPSLFDKASASSPASTYADTTMNELGFHMLPHARAAMAPLVYGAMNMATGQDIHPDSYVNERDQNIRDLKASQDANPDEAALGKLSALVLGGVGMNRVANKLGNSGLSSWLAGKMSPQVAKYGAEAGKVAPWLTNSAISGVEMAIQNPGDEEGKIAPLQLLPRALQGAGGFVAGAAMSAGGAGSRRVGSKMARSATGGQHLTSEQGTMLLDESIPSYSPQGQQAAEQSYLNRSKNDVDRMAQDAGRTQVDRANQARSALGLDQIQNPPGTGIESTDLSQKFRDKMLPRVQDKSGYVIPQRQADYDRIQELSKVLDARGNLQSDVVFSTGQKYGQSPQAYDANGKPINDFESELMRALNEVHTGATKEHYATQFPAEQGQMTDMEKVLAKRHAVSSLPDITDRISTKRSNWAALKDLISYPVMSTGAYMADDAGKALNAASSSAGAINQYWNRKRQSEEQ